MSVSDTGYAEMVMNIFPLFSVDGFEPDFSGYDFDNIDWDKVYQGMAPSPEETIMFVSSSYYNITSNTVPYKQLLILTKWPGYCVFFVHSILED